MSSDGKTPIKLSIGYISNKDFEDIRMKIWDTYNSNAQNHTNYILSVVVALVAFVTGFMSLSTSNIIGLNNVLLVAGVLIPSLSIIFVWLYLRNMYWCIWTEATALMTREEIKALFDKSNEENEYYLTVTPPLTITPPHSAVVLLAVSEHVRQMKENPKKFDLTFWRRAALNTNPKL